MESQAGHNQAKTLPSQLDELGVMLSAIPEPLGVVPAVTAFQLPGTLGSCCFSESSTAASSSLDWSALPASVDADSTAVGISTRKMTAKQQAKQRPVDAAKVQARVARKRAQVESFLLALQPLLQAAGHSLAAGQVKGLQQQPSSTNSSTPHTGLLAPLQQLSVNEQPGQQQEHKQQHPQQQQYEHAGQALHQSPAQTQALLPTNCQQRHEQQHQQHPQPHANAQQRQQQGQVLRRPAGPLSLHIVDFGCGTGNLLLPLAALLPGCRFTGVDMKPAALQLLQNRAAAAGLANVAVFQGMIEQFRQPFDVGLALHACGNATDHVLQLSVEHRAAFVVSPCCVGKLRFSMTGGSSFCSKPITYTPTQPGDRPVRWQDSTASSTQQQPLSGVAPQNSNAQQEQHQQQQQQHLEQQRQVVQPGHTVLQQQQQQQEQQQQQQKEEDSTAGMAKLRHPRSDWLMSHLPDPERHFRTMAKVADMSHAPIDRAELSEALKQRATLADTCKRFVELDRCAAAAEACYAVGLFKVLQAEAMAKNDLLVGLPLPRPDAAAAAAAEDVAAAVGRVAGSVGAADTAASAADADVPDAAGVAACASDGVTQLVAAVECNMHCRVADVAVNGVGSVKTDVRSCLCMCGQALHRSGVLFTSDKLGAACKTL